MADFNIDDFDRRMNEARESGNYLLLLALQLRACEKITYSFGVGFCLVKMC